MKRPNSLTIRRPKPPSTGTARSHKEAAIQLVRLEFDINRLERAIALAESRAKTHRRELDARQAERAKLMTLLER